MDYPTADGTIVDANGRRQFADVEPGQQAGTDLCAAVMNPPTNEIVNAIKMSGQTASVQDETQLAAAIRWLCLLAPYSQDLANKTGGYPLNSIVSSADTPGVFWVSNATGNTAPPGGSSWQSLFSGYIQATVSDARYLAQAGPPQNCSSPTTFVNGLFTGIDVEEWDTNAVPSAASIGSNFLSKTGNDQLSSSPTTFSNGLWSTGLFYASKIEAVGTEDSAYVTLGSSLRCGINTIYVNYILIDGEAERVITGVTNVSDQWNFGTRPNVIGEPVALLNDLAIASTDFDQHFVAAGVSSGSTIKFPTSFSDVPVVQPQIIGVASVTCNLAQASSPGSFVISISATGTYSVSVRAIGPR